MSMVVRMAKEEDASSISRYFAQFYAMDPDTVFSRPEGIPERDVLHLIKQTESNSGCLFLIALSGQAVVGTLTFSRHIKLEMSHGGEFGMSVHHGYRRQGVGTHLIRSMLKWAVDTGLEKIDLQVWSNNVGGIALYEKNGFVHEGIRKGAIKRDGSTIDIILMTRFLVQQGAQPDAFAAPEYEP